MLMEQRLSRIMRWQNFVTFISNLFSTFNQIIDWDLWVSKIITWLFSNLDWIINKKNFLHRFLHWWFHRFTICWIGHINTSASNILNLSMSTFQNFSFWKIKLLSCVKIFSRFASQTKMLRSVRSFEINAFCRWLKCNKSRWRLNKVKFLLLLITWCDHVSRFWWTSGRSCK